LAVRVHRWECRREAVSHFVVVFVVYVFLSPPRRLDAYVCLRLPIFLLEYDVAKGRFCTLRRERQRSYCLYDLMFNLSYVVTFYQDAHHSHIVHTFEDVNDNCPRKEFLFIIWSCCPKRQAKEKVPKTSYQTNSQEEHISVQRSK